MTAPEPAQLPVDLVAAIAPGTGRFDASRDWPILLEACVEHIPHVDAASMLARNADGTLHFVAAVGLDFSVLSALQFAPSTLNPRKRDGVLLEPRLDDSMLSEHERATLASAGGGHAISETISVAVRPGGRLIGYIQLDALDGRTFDEHDVAVAAAVAELVAARVDRGTLQANVIQAQRDLARISTHDVTTGLANRMLLLEQLERALARDHRSNLATAFLHVVIQDMTRINDAYGHDRGDEMLRNFAQRLMQTTRGGDTVAHFGNGEFGVLATDISEIDAVEALVDRIEALSDQPIELADTPLHPHLAIGVALSPTDGTSRDTLVRSAELASSRALANQRQQVAWFMHDVNPEQRERSRLAEELRAALISGQGIWVAFQPVHKMSDGQCLGIEALARWDRITSSDDMIPPSVFGPLTEELGMTHVLSERVYGRAFAVFASLASIRGEQPWRLTLNLSPSQLQDDDLAQLLQKLSSEHGVPLEELDLDVPAEMMFTASAGALQRLRTLRELGCHIVIDDFAALRDEIERLEGLPVDMLKIHPRWTQPSTDELARRRVEGIVSAAHRLGLNVVAESVETETAASHLASLGVDALQGFAVTPPMHAAALFAYLSTQSLLD